MKPKVVILKLDKPVELGYNFKIKTMTGLPVLESLSGKVYAEGDHLTSKDVDDIVNHNYLKQCTISVIAA